MYEHHECAERAVELQRLTDGGQQGRTGLGYLKKRITHPSAEEDRKGHRKAVTSFIVQEENDNRRVHLMGLAKQGKWSSWDNLMQQDLSWYRLLYDMPPNILKFMMNGTTNTLPSPVNLKLWHKEVLDNCPLCNHPHCAMIHILSMCPVALKQGRYMWRHNLVLREFVRFLKSHLDNVNKSPPLQSNTAFISFVRAQKSKHHNSSSTSSSSTSSDSMKKQFVSGLLSSARDWKLQVDLSDHDELKIEPYKFAPSIAVTLKRPDIVCWSLSRKIVILIELTVPAEFNVIKAQERKTMKYLELTHDIECNGFDVHLFTFEVGTLGYCANTVNYLCKELGMLSQKKDLCNRMSIMALRGSYGIWLCRCEKEWATFSSS